MTKEEAIEVYNGLINDKIKEAFEFFAPELAENEDEKIRKTLINIVKGACDQYGIKYRGNISEEKLLAYLEKKEQKSGWSEEDKKIVETICKEGDLKPSEQRWLKSLPERFNLQPKQGWSEEDKLHLNNAILAAEKEWGSNGFTVRWLKSLLYLDYEKK